MRSYKSLDVSSSIFNSSGICVWLTSHIKRWLFGCIHRLFVISLWSYNNLKWYWFIFTLQRCWCKFVTKWFMSVSFRVASVIFAFFFAIFNFTVLASVKPYFAVWCFYLLCRLFPLLTCPLWHLFFRFHIFASSKTLLIISALLPAVVIFSTIWVNFSCFKMMHFFMAYVFFFT